MNSNIPGFMASLGKILAVTCIQNSCPKNHVFRNLQRVALWQSLRLCSALDRAEDDSPVA
jgi:hypothetical protein